MDIAIAPQPQAEVVPTQGREAGVKSVWIDLINLNTDGLEPTLARLDLSEKYLTLTVADGLAIRIKRKDLDRIHDSEGISEPSILHED